VEGRRRTARLTRNEVPEILRNPILLHNYEEIKSEIENLSPLGIGLVIEKEIILNPGDIFYLKYHSLESDIKCVCVFSDLDGEKKSIGAYFTDQEDQKIILKHLQLQVII